MKHTRFLIHLEPELVKYLSEQKQLVSKVAENYMTHGLYTKHSSASLAVCNGMNVPKMVMPCTHYLTCVYLPQLGILTLSLGYQIGKDSVFLGCYAVPTSKQSLTFQRSMLSC